MLPPGHIAGGFLAAYGLLKVAQPDIPPSQINQLLALGATFGFAPDLDYFVTFAKEKAFTVKDFKTNNHRKFPSHAPLLWLTASLLIYFFTDSEFVKSLGLVIWVGSWSHFILDTIEYGVMWFWPFSNRKIYLKFLNEKSISESGFWKFWIGFAVNYAKTISFYLEILIFLIGCYFFIRLF